MYRHLYVGADDQITNKHGEIFLGQSQGRGQIEWKLKIIAELLTEQKFSKDEDGVPVGDITSINKLFIDVGETDGGDWVSSNGATVLDIKMGILKGNSGMDLKSAQLDINEVNYKILDGVGYYVKIKMPHDINQRS